MKKIAVLGGIFAITPMIAFAALDTNRGLGKALLVISDTISYILPIIVALALLYFFWGLAKYIINSGDEEKKSEGRNIMIWGIITLFIMVSVWGLVNLLVDTFSLSEGSLKVPDILGR